MREISNKSSNELNGYTKLCFLSTPFLTELFEYLICITHI